MKTPSGNGGKDDGIGLSEDCGGFGKSHWAIGVLRVRRRLEILLARPPQKPWQNFLDEELLDDYCGLQDLKPRAKSSLFTPRKPPDKMEIDDALDTADANDADMTEVAAMGKRAAPSGMSETEGQKKHNKRIQIVEPEADETVVSTKANPHVFNPFLEQLSGKMRQLATKPYTALFGEDKGDANAFHDDLQALLMMTGRWVHNVKILQQDKLKQIKEAPHRHQSLPQRNGRRSSASYSRKRKDK